MGLPGRPRSSRTEGYTPVGRAVGPRCSPRKGSFVESLAGLLPILALVLIFWLLLIRPAQRRQRQLHSVQDALAVGDPVLTSAGIFGTVAHLDDDKVGLEVATGVVITVARGAVVGLVKELEEEQQLESTVEQEEE